MNQRSPVLKIHLPNHKRNVLSLIWIIELSLKVPLKECYFYQSFKPAAFKGQPFPEDIWMAAKVSVNSHNRDTAKNF